MSPLHKKETEMKHDTHKILQDLLDVQRRVLQAKPEDVLHPAFRSTRQLLMVTREEIQEHWKPSPVKKAAMETITDTLRYIYEGSLYATMPRLTASSDSATQPCGAD